MKFMSARVVTAASLNILERLKERTKYTPDFSTLRWFPEIPLFVYDSLRLGGDDHESVMNGSKFCGKAHSVTPHFSLSRKTDIPVCFNETNECIWRSHVRGELFVVSIEHIHTLDVILMNGFKYKRIPFKVFLEDQSPVGAPKIEQIPWVNAFIYLGIKEYWKVKELIRLPNTEHRNNSILHRKQVCEWNPLANSESFQWGRASTVPSDNNGMGTAIYPAVLPEDGPGSPLYGNEFDGFHERQHAVVTGVEYDDEDNTLFAGHWNGYNTDRRRIM